MFLCDDFPAIEFSPAGHRRAGLARSRAERRGRCASFAAAAHLVGGRMAAIWGS
jgi:hypothetical protein